MNERIISTIFIKLSLRKKNHLFYNYLKPLYTGKRYFRFVID